MRFGKYDCFTVVMDSFLLDGGAMFGVVPKNLWEAKIPADAKNRIPMQARSLVISGNGKIILVDNGIGDKLPEKLTAIYGIRTPVHSMEDRLAPFGLRVEEITDVIITHLHFDHAGGSTRLVDGKATPTFPNAMYHVQQAQWDLACHPSVRDRSSYIPENFMPLLENGVLNILDGPSDNFFDGIDLLVTDGHTRGQQHPLVRGEGQSLFFCADLIPTSAHLPSAWHMAYDNLPLTVMDEKDRILARALDENWVLCFEHDPAVAAATVKSEKGRVGVDQVVEL